MRAAGPEGHVRIGVARHIENVSVRKDVLVAVCGAVVHHYLFALAYLLGPDLRVSRDGAAEVDDGGHPAQHLFDRGRYQRWIGEKTIALVGMFDEGQHASRGYIASGLVAGNGNEHAEVVKRVFDDALSV